MITAIAVVNKTETASEHRASSQELILVELFIVIKVTFLSFLLKEPVSNRKSNNNVWLERTEENGTQPRTMKQVSKSVSLSVSQTNRQTVSQSVRY